MVTLFPKLLTEADAAAILGISPQTLTVWRCKKRYDLQWVKVGGRVRYKEADILAFIERRTRNGQVSGDGEVA